MSLESPSIIIYYPLKETNTFFPSARIHREYVPIEFISLGNGGLILTPTNIFDLYIFY